MSKRTNILFLWMAALMWLPTVAMAEHSAMCDSMRSIQQLPQHFCECYENAEKFAFPLVRELSDTAWYEAPVPELRQGISAYWLADCSLTLEVFAFCTSWGPAFSVTVGPNRMTDVDNAYINQKLEELGDKAKPMVEAMGARVRAYTNGGSGKVYCYPYDQGPESTCDDPLPLLPRMTYVCDKPYNVYRLDSKQISASGKTFIHWKQKKNLPCEVWLTLDSCNGEEIGRAALSDSLHIFQPDSLVFLRARSAKRSIWLHVAHEEGYTGRIYYYTTRHFIDPLDDVSKKTCYGKTLEVDLRTYENDTVFADTLWVTDDTLQTRNVKLTFTQPKLEYDTIRVPEKQLKQGYRYTPSGTTLYAYGDTIVEVKKANTCTRRIQVTVKRPGEAVDTVEVGKPNAYKQIQNGQLFIIIDDRKYNVLGQQSKQHN